MFIFNITFLVSDNSATKWYDWVKKDHIPFMLSSGYFTKPQLAKVLNNHGQDGTSYSVQYQVANKKDLEQWHLTCADKMQNECNEIFGEEVLLFTTVLELIQ